MPLDPSQDEELQKYLATQSPEQPSHLEQAVTAPTPNVQLPQPSKLSSILTGLGSTIKGEDPVHSMRALQRQKQDEFLTNRALQEDERQKNITTAKTLDELHSSKVSAPTLKATLKGLPGISPEISAGIDGMDDTTLRNFLPRLSDTLKLHNDMTDAINHSAAQKETERHNKADEQNQRFHYEQLRTEAGDKRAFKDEQTTQKRVDDTLDTLATVKRGASAGTFGMATKRSMLAADGLRIIKQIEDGKIASDPAVQNELATVMASSLSGGSAPGEHAVKAFVQRTGKGDAAKAAIWLSSNPQDAVSKAYLKQWKEQLKGQDKYYNDARDNTIKSQWEKLKPSLDKSDTEKKRFVRAIKSQYPEFDIKKLGEKDSDYGFGADEISGASDDDLMRRKKELEAKKGAK